MIENHNLTSEKVTFKNKNKKKQLITDILWAFAYLAITAAICVTVFYSVNSRYFEDVFVKGSSMEPTLKGCDKDIGGIAEYGQIDTHQAAIRDVGRYQIITTYYSDIDTEFKIKRVLFLPGETFSIKNNQIYLYLNNIPYLLPIEEGGYFARKCYMSHSYNGGAKTTLKADEYFVAGDNWDNSTDSFDNGPIKARWITGVINFISGTCKVSYDAKGNFTAEEKTPYKEKRFFPARSNKELLGF